VLEVEREGALAMKKGCALRVGVAVAKRALRAEVGRVAVLRFPPLRKTLSDLRRSRHSLRGDGA